MSQAPRRLSIPTILSPSPRHTPQIHRVDKTEEKSSVSLSGSLFHTSPNSSPIENSNAFNNHDPKFAHNPIFTAEFLRHYMPSDGSEDVLRQLLIRNSIFFNRNIANEFAKNWKTSDIVDALKILDRKLYDAYFSTEGNRIGLIQAALNKGSDINAYFPGMGSILRHAVVHVDLPMVQFLLQNNANPNIPIIGGSRILDVATGNVSLEVATRNATRNIPINGDLIILNVAINTNQNLAREILKLLIKYKADLISFVTNTNHSPLEYAIIMVNPIAVKCLLPHVPKIIGDELYGGWTGTYLEHRPNDTDERVQQKNQIKQLIYDEIMYRDGPYAAYEAEMISFPIKQNTFLLGTHDRVGKYSAVLKLKGGASDITDAIFSFITPEIPQHPFADNKED